MNIEFRAPARVSDQVTTILRDRSLTHRDRANRAVSLMVPLLFADSGITPPDPIHLADALEIRTSPIAPLGQSDEATLDAILRNEVIR